MPAAIKRRKVTTTTKNASSSLSKPRGLDAFTRVSKAGTTTKVVSEKNNYVDSIAITQLEGKYATTKGKRKLVTSDEESATLPSAIEARFINPLPARKSIAVPKIPSTGSSTKSTHILLNHLFLSSKSPLPASKLKSTPKPSTPPASRQDLPIELLDLINLHAAFLTALSLHYAHNGSSSPADLRQLCPDVARAWGKRSITREDIQRTLGVLNTAILADKKSEDKEPRLSLADYGYGKICIEISEISSGAFKLLDEDVLNGMFVRGLKAAWEKKSDEMGVKDFIQGLPKEDISTSSLSKISPLLAKGQRRLEDLRAGITIKKAEKEMKVEVIGAEGKKLTLLERLRAKQLHQSTLPPPPSKAALSRNAALQRVEEVAGVLSILSTSSSVGQQRISFTLPTVLGKLRDSFKNPMSKAEGEMCLRLLAEVAPDWVRIVKMGKVEALVVNRDERPTEAEMRGRVERCASA